MLLWIAVGLFVVGLLCFAIDRPLAHFLRARLVQPWRKRVRLTTDFAKALHWLIVAVLLYAGTQAAMALGYEAPILHRVSNFSAALLLSLLAASAILHTSKLFIGRRRPRDDFEHGFYGFEFALMNTQHDSFPSGHAQTIFCVATVVSATWPSFAPLWFAVAAYLALTRAALASHFLSDVFIGAALGLIVTREIFVFVFPALMPAWF
jgi:membrane-associated phospholipid phosphatase